MSETLESALAAFAARRSALIAAKVAELGRAAAADAAARAPAARKNIEFQRAWVGAVAEPAARGRCLDQLTAKLPKVDEEGTERSWGETCYALEARLRALLEVGPDPRIVTTMLAKLELNEPVIGVAGVQDLIWKLIERHADDGTGDALRAAGHELGELDLPAKVSLTADEQAYWRPTAVAVPHDTKALWADVFAAPDDDEPRLVLADALMEMGDPRGELIAIQLREARGDAGDEAGARAAELVKQHGKEWLEALRPIVYRAEYVRGVVTRLELAGAWSSSKYVDIDNPFQ